jgi:hypothetical protein
MTTEKYNGYANYETWAVVLWLENDEGMYRYWREAASEARQEAATCREVLEDVWPAKDAPKYLLSERLEGEVSDGCPDLEPSLYLDLLNAALSEVDWHEVAEQFLEE